MKEIIFSKENSEKLKQYNYDKNKNINEFNYKNELDYANDISQVEKKTYIERVDEYSNELKPTEEVVIELPKYGEDVSIPKVSTTPEPADLAGPLPAPITQTPPNAQDGVAPTSSVQFNSRLNRLYSSAGVVYKFNRGIAVVGPDGKKINDVFDRTRKHHGPRAAQIALEDFGIDLGYDFNDPRTISEVFFVCCAAADNNLGVCLFEGNNCQIYLPENVTNDQIEQIMLEVMPRGDFEFYIQRNGAATDTLTRDECLGYLNDLLVKEEEKTEDEKDDIDTYLNNVNDYLNRYNLTPQQYFEMVGQVYRLEREDTLEEFERRNPFIDENAISNLANNNGAVADFVNTMTNIYNEHFNINHDEDEYNDYESDDYNDENNENLHNHNVSSEKLSKEDYINIVLTITNNLNITLEEYYLVAAQALRTTNGILANFERRNPFLDDHDIELLVNSTDERINEYFASAMAKVIRLNINNKNLEAEDTDEDENNNSDGESSSEENDEIDDEEEHTVPKTVIINVNEDIINSMQGFKLNRESRTDYGVTGYMYRKGEESLTEKRVVTQRPVDVSNGDYINIVETYYNLLKDLIENNGENARYSFTNEEGNEISIDEVMNQIFNEAKQTGMISFGRAEGYINIDTFQELVDEIKLEKDNFNGQMLYRGAYVPKNLVVNTLTKYKVMVKTGEESTRVR